MSTSFLLSTIIIISTTILLGFILVLRRNNHSDIKGYTLTKEEMNKYVVWMIFYVNPLDPRGTVPKTLGSGNTINFRNKRNVSIFAGLILLVMFCTFALVICFPNIEHGL